MTRITADPAASEYVEAMSPQPPLGARYVLTESQRFAQCIYDDPRRSGGIGFVPPVATSADTRLECPYRIGQTVDLLPPCDVCGEPAEIAGVCDVHYKAGFRGIGVQWPYKPIPRRITSIRCEQREGTWCWVLGLGKVE